MEIKWQEIKGKSISELEILLSQGKRELLDLRFKVATGALKQVRKIRVLKKTIARLMLQIYKLKKN